MCCDAELMSATVVNYKGISACDELGDASVFLYVWIACVRNTAHMQVVRIAF